MPKAHAANTDAPALRVLSYSTWATNRDVNADAIARMIVSARADVVALQEIDAKTLANIQAALMTLDPKSTWHFVADFEIDLATLSRLPISITKVEALRTRLLQAQVLTSVGPVTIWNIHAFRPDFKQSGLSFLAYGGGDVAQPDTTGQIDWLADAASKVTEPMVLMGDFNFPYLSPDHRWLSRALRDAHWEAEWGFGFTFPASDAHARRINVFGRRFAIASPMRLAKIDHIFYNAHLVVREAHTLADSAGSDHAPVIAEFAL